MQAILFFVVFAVLPAVIFASSAQKAAVHFKVIAAGNAGQIMRSYAPKARFQRIGGPLDGAYAGKAAIRRVGSTFAKANTPLKVHTAKLKTRANPKGAAVTAHVIFQGKSAIKVRYGLPYRGGRIVDEVWQVEPKLAMKAG
ncbi:MAG TPA: hypothetical protein DEP05_03940 [Betaproteobacteria bacterium]|nr:hypothetical protein [Betaproteobacteria bacterium]